MSQVFNITIAATDKATATVRKINDSISKITRPFEEVGKSFKSLGREVGFDKISANLSKMGIAARDAARGVGSIVAPLAGITSVASVAGVIGLADSVAKLGRNLTYSAQNIGVSTTSLQQWRGVALQAGLSSDAMTQSLSSLGKTMEDAVSGRNQLAYMEFGRVGVSLKQTSKGLWDVNGALEHIADYVNSKKNPQAQAMILSTLGISPELLPLLRQGSKAIRAHADELRKAGYIMSPAQIDSAKQFADQLSKMDVSATALKNSIGNALMPALVPLVSELDDWVQKNHALLSQKIGEYAREFGKWLESINWKQIGHELHETFSTIGKVVDALGGVKGVLIEIAAYKSLTLFTNVATSVYRIGLLTKAMLGLKKAAGEAAAAEAAAGAGGVGVPPVAKVGAAGFLSKLLGAGGWAGLLKAAMFAPRPSEASVSAVHADVAKFSASHESYWQKWADVFHWRMSGATAPATLQRPALAKPRPSGRADDNIDLFGGRHTRGIRNNNPGNLKYNDFTRGLGATGMDAAGFAIFATPQQGLNAIAANLRSYGRKGFDTPSEIAHRWSTTDQDAYTRRLANLFGGDPNKPLNMGDPAVIDALRNGIITQENGSNPYATPQGPYSQGMAMKNAPQEVHVVVSAEPGTKAKVKPADNVTASTRVGYRSVGAMA